MKRKKTLNRDIWVWLVNSYITLEEEEEEEQDDEEGENGEEGNKNFIFMIFEMD